MGEYAVKLATVSLQKQKEMDEKLEKEAREGGAKAEADEEPKESGIGKCLLDVLWCRSRAEELGRGHIRT